MAFMTLKTKINFVRNAILSPVKKTLDVTLRVLVPPACPLCKGVLAGDDGLCAPCWQDLHFITAPICQISGAPLDVDLGPETVSLAMQKNPPPYEKARAAFRYEGSAAALVKRLKFSDRPELARLLAPFMVRAGQDVLRANALLVPVPLHRRRLLGRRFNQAAELCRAMARETGNEIVFQAVQRVKATRPQIGLTRRNRKRNLKGAFTVPKSMKDQIQGRSLVLVDDVLTTGATVEAMSETLRQAGAGRIYVLTLARVVRPEQMRAS
jgi:ComF family protein